MSATAGRYRVLRRLGAGAAGGVYLVSDTAFDGPPVALKCVQPSRDPRFRDSFAREFAVLSSLALPGVACVHDLGVSPAGGELPEGPFFTRDYIEGSSLDDVALQRGLDQVLPIFAQVVGIVAQVHRAGVVHGDIKPANVIVDAGDQPFLIDFGLASRVADADGLRGSGTPLFMAPELLQGAAPWTGADVYALGATLWAISLGAPPFAGEGMAGLTAKVKGRPPVAAGNLSALQQKVLPVALRALAANKKERTPSAGELLAELEQAVGLAHRRPESPRRVQPAPRIRGRDALLDELTECALLGDDQQARVCLVEGVAGMGKTSLLRELRWRLQLASAHVIETRCGVGGLDPFVQLFSQALLHRPQLQASLRGSIERARSGEASRAELIEGVEVALNADGLSGPMVLLVDDIDGAEPLFLDALRSAIHQELSRSPRLVLTARPSQAVSALASLATQPPHRVGGLSEPDARQVVRDVLGPIDDAVEGRLVALSEGNPGLLIEMLTQLAERDGVTEGDLLDLVPGKLWASRGRAQVARVGPLAQRLFAALSVARRPLTETFLQRWLGEPCAEAIGALIDSGLCSREQDWLQASESTAAAWVRRQPGSAGGSETAKSLLAHPACCELDVTIQAELALAAGDEGAVSRLAPEAARVLARQGANLAAIRMYEAALAHTRAQDAAVELRLALSELCGLTGDFGRAAAEAEAVLEGGRLAPKAQARARVCAGRALVAAGQLERAVSVLADIPRDAPAVLHAEAAREQARVFLRKGAHADALQAVKRGLAAMSDEHAVCAELYAIEAALKSLSGDHASARACYERAHEVAEQWGSVRDRAQVIGYGALACEQEGLLERARELYEQGIEAARSAADLSLTATYALNLGNVSFRIGRTESAERYFALAARMARRAGRTTTALLADNNLGHLSVYLGSYARARQLAEGSKAAARHQGVDIAHAHALHILADIDARTGHVERALAGYAEASALYQKLGRHKELCEALLDAADALLDRGGASDASLASAKLASARELTESHELTDLRPRLRLLLARARCNNGDVEGAVRDLEAQERELDAYRDREVRWQLLFAQAQMYRLLGSALLSGTKARQAAELLEVAAANLPRDARDAFRADPRRRAVFELSRRAADSSARAGALESSSTAPDPRFVRLLDIIKRLARERELERVLERITDAAVDLSGAERGFVLLVDESGALSTHTVRASGGNEHDPHVAFSRSIAEAVLIDGEPIVTVNARDDRRVNGFMSVHKLMLKSVACIPINGPGGTVGVLYLEHRVRPGRFDERDLDLLLAFADQAAIALENARLWAENQRSQRDLEAKNRQLMAANAEIERLLEARTEELEEAHRELRRARADLERQATRHGIVGRSPAMQRVFALIERLQDTTISVVVQGESGTGKELVAKAIHYGGCRRKGPFVAVNCAALPEHLLESELFGHVRGAFTGADRDRKGLFARAHGGTLFLDEFAEISPRMQIDLLRVLQEGCVRPVGGDVDVAVDVRVIAASNRPLEELVRAKRLREDLYYRLGVVELRLPPLRERPQDIPLLCDHLLSQIAAQQGVRPMRLSAEALRCIKEMVLPGNVRQLEHMLLSACTMGDGGTIEPHDLPTEGRAVSEAPPPPGLAAEAAAASSAPPPSDVRGHKERERARILEALERHAWNRAKAASALGMARRTFYRRLAEFGIL